MCIRDRASAQHCSFGSAWREYVIEEIAMLYTCIKDSRVYIVHCFAQHSFSHLTLDTFVVYSTRNHTRHSVFIRHSASAERNRMEFGWLGAAKGLCLEESEIRGGRVGRSTMMFRCIIGRQCNGH